MSNGNNGSGREVVMAGVAASAVALAAGYFFVMKPMQDELRKLEEKRKDAERTIELVRATASSSKKDNNPTISLSKAKGAHYWPDPAITTPAQFFDFLLERNKLFVDGHFYLPDLSAKRRRTVSDKGQFPPVALVCCADSRVPPEYLFGAGVGDLFLVRAAGNAVDRLGVGSLEFAVEKLKIKLIVIMGHSQCGAISAAVNYAKGEMKKGPIDVVNTPIAVDRSGEDSIWTLVESCLVPAREAVVEADPDCSETTTFEDAIARNVKHQANVLWTNSKILREAVRSKRIAIRCARSFIRTGQVFEIPHVPRKEKRAVLSPPKPIFVPPAEAVLPDD